METKRRDILTDLRREISSNNTEHSGILLRLETAQADIRELGVELVKERVGCLESVRETLSGEEKPLRRRMHEAFEQLDRAHGRFRGKIREVGVADADLHKEHERLEQTAERLRRLEEEVGGKEALLDARIKDGARLDTELEKKSAERDRLLEALGETEKLITQKEGAAQELVDLESEISRRKEGLGALRKTVAELEENAGEKTAVLEAFKKKADVELPEREAELKKMREEELGLEAALAKYNSRLSEFEKELPDAERALAELKERAASLERQKNETLARTEKLRSAIAPVKPHFLRQEKELERARELRQELEKAIQEREKDLGPLKDAAAKLQSEKDGHAERWRTLSNEIGALRTELTRREREGERIVNEIRRLKTEVVPAKCKALKEVKQKALLEEALKRGLADRLGLIGKELRILKERKDGFIAQAERIERQELPSGRAALEKLAAEIAAIERETKKRGELIAESGSDASQAERFVKDLSGEDSRLKGRIQANEAAKQELEQVLAGLDSVLAQKKAHCDELSRQAAQRRAERKQHAEALVEMRTSITSLKNDIAARKKERRKLQEDSDELLSRMRTCDKESGEISLKLTQAKTARENLRQQFGALSGELGKKEGKRQALLAEIAPKQAILDAKRAEGKKVEGDIRFLEEKDIPRIEEELKGKRAEVRLSQAKLQKFEEALTSLERGVHPQYDKLIELKKRAGLFRAQLEESVVTQSRLNRALESRGDEIGKKRAEREELSQRRVELESEISAREEALAKTQRPLGSLVERLKGMDELLAEADQSVGRERRLLSKLLPVRWSKVAWWLALASLTGSAAAVVFFRLLTQ